MSSILAIGGVGAAHATDEDNAGYYYIGLRLQKTLEACDVPSTAAQRNGVSQKLASVRSYISQIVVDKATERVTSDGADCPKNASENAEVAQMLTTFLEKTPDQFFAAMDAKDNSGKAAASGESKAPALPSVPGWQIDDKDCTIYHDYRDPDDDNAFNAVMFMRRKDAVIVILKYENWERKRGEQIKAKFLVDEKLVNSSTTWTSKDGGQLMTAGFDNSLLTTLAAAHLLELEFNGVTADFKIPNVGAALTALDRCAAL